MYLSCSDKANGQQNTATDLVASVAEELETPQQRRSRHISLYIVHLSMLVVSLGSSIIFTGVYPYLLSVTRPTLPTLDQQLFCFSLTQK